MTTDKEFLEADVEAFLEYATSRGFHLCVDYGRYREHEFFHADRREVSKLITEFVNKNE